MKRYLLFFLLLISMSANAQEWINCCSSSDTDFYVNSTIRPRGKYIVAFQKSVPKNIYAERSKFVRDRNDSKWNKYSYTILTILVDLDLYRVKSLSIAWYDTDGRTLDSYNPEDDNWNYATPNTILEGICETVEYISTAE